MLPVPAGLSRMACAFALAHPTIRLPLAPSARPAELHEPMPMLPNLKVLPIEPSVLISTTPPAGSPLNDGIETKNEPVNGSQTGCSMPSLAAAPGTLMLDLKIVTGGDAVLNNVANAGLSALFAARRCCVAGEYAISSTRKLPPVEIDCSWFGVAGLVTLNTFRVLFPSPA